MFLFRDYVPLKGDPLLEVGIFLVKMGFRHQWRSHSSLLFV